MLKACLLAAAVCMDVFFAAIGCSMSGILIPKRCAALISAVGTAFLAVSVLGASLLGRFLPESVCRYGGAALLLIMGSMTLMKEALRAVFRAHRPHIRRRALGLVIDICFDETLADADGSKTLSIPEALSFAAAMSLDSLASGLGAGLKGLEMPVCLLLTLILGYILTVAGSVIGKKCQNQCRLSWLGGVMLVLLAICRIWL